MTALFAWPPRAAVGRVVPKDRVYTGATVTIALRQRFVDEVAQIRWAFKLSEATVGLAATDELPEVQVFEVDLHGADVDNRVLAAIDRAIPSPVVFELCRTDGLWVERATAAAAQPLGVRVAKPSDYVRTRWIRADGPRVDLPVALDLTGLHLQLLAALLPHPLRTGETLGEAVERMREIRTLERAVTATERRMRAERQFNRQADMRREVLAARAALATLTGAG